MDISKRIVVDVFLQTIGTSINTNLYFRNGTLSHLHTTLLATTQGAQGSIGFQGLQGLIGNTGSTGARGLQGTVGNQGPQGLNGVQGNPGPTGTLSGSVTFTQGSQIPVNTDVDNYSLTDGTLFLMTGSGGINFNGIANGAVGRFIVLINNSAGNVIFKQEASTSTTTNRFSLATSQITVGTNSTITFIYGNTTLGNRWLCVAKQ